MQHLWSSLCLENRTLRSFEETQPCTTNSVIFMSKDNATLSIQLGVVYVPCSVRSQPMITTLTNDLRRTTSWCTTETNFVVQKNFVDGVQRFEIAFASNLLQLIREPMWLSGCNVDAVRNASKERNFSPRPQRAYLPQMEYTVKIVMINYISSNKMHRNAHTNSTVFIPDIFFFGGGGLPVPKNLHFP